ncbi:MAG: hypothetical protein GQ570_00220 [Helicobacteraceae bacterium]|nr:hypothetical protein [Helicobacteraceae bacterium]
MCDFNNLDEETRSAYHAQLIECADSLGGKNFFLNLLEAIRKNKPHPLVAKTTTFSYANGTIKWNKVIFQDKISLLLKERVNESGRGNFLPKSSDKNYKTVMNLIRTLTPIEFKIKPKNRDDGAGFSVKAFDMISPEQTKINPLFDAIFFCSIETVKKVLNYKPNEA